jgi:hypothetical protein
MQTILSRDPFQYHDHLLMGESVTLKSLDARLKYLQMMRFFQFFFSFSLSTNPRSRV